MLKKLFKWFKKDVVHATIVPRAEHGISRDNISKNALKVLYRLHNAGFGAFLVGGCIRDLLLGKHPKDFDIATNADPEQVKQLFSNCRLIGRRFRLAHVHFGSEIIEVATFRAPHVASSVQNVHGMILRDNEWGSIEEDVLRRDFTINALYYNIADFSVVDFVSGMQDIKKQQLNLIGNPEKRYREDPVRMLRAIRFAAKLGFSIHPNSAKPILTMGNLLANVPAARLFEEYNKLFLTGHAYSTYNLLIEYDLFKQLFPRTAKLPVNDPFVVAALRNTDARIAAEKSISPSFLLAVFSWQPLQELAQRIDFHDAMDQILREQQRVMAVPRRFVGMIRDVWEVQQRLEHRRTPRQIESLFALSKFRAAYDFLLLRAQAGEQQVIPSAEWWRTYVEGDEDVRNKLLAKIKPSKRKKKKPKVNTDTLSGTQSC
ncbi:MAG TPA: polynucleotide adenylyltransferase PcnB [Gammaproteobacteria bacterium]|nr:polynucleotide adenylyltransferase PcnB [Gammaproteobacteria bacterium]